MPRPTALLLLALLALLAPACADDDGGGGGGTAGGATSSTVSPDVGVDDPLETCENPGEGYEIGYPESWRTNPADVMPPCSLFDREEIADIEPGTEIPRGIDVTVLVEPVAYERAAQDPTGEEVLSRDEPDIGGPPATRIEAEATQREPGTRATRWVIDLGDGRSLVAATVEAEGAGDAYERNREVLDRMVGSLELTGDAGSTTTTTAAGSGEEGPQPVGQPGTAPKASDDFPTSQGDPAFLYDVRVASHPGFDRIVFDLEGTDPPSWRVAPIAPPIRQSGSGNEVEVAGSHFVEVVLEPASGVDLSGAQPRQVYDGPQRIEVPGDGPVTEVVRTGDFENNLSWVLGVERPAPFGVALLQDPLRLVVDVVAAE